MPRLSKFYGIVVYLYYFDHNPPHFHAQYGEFECVISIVDLKLLYGSLPQRAFALVVEWAILHHDELVDSWQKAKQGDVPGPILPLP